MVETPDFESLYRGDRDPWRVASSPYEQRKQGVLLASLGSARYASAWDPFCGTGELVRRLAARCTLVRASDASAAAVQITRERCADRPNVAVSRLALPADPGFTGAPPDLVVLAESLYYLDGDGRRRTLALVSRLAAGTAEVMSLHWRHRAEDAWLSGADMQREIVDGLTAAGWAATVHHEEPDFVLDAFRR